MGWYYAAGGETIGPVTAEDVAALLHRRTLRLTDNVWTESFGQQWKPIADIPELIPEPVSALRRVQRLLAIAGSRVPHPLAEPAPRPRGSILGHLFLMSFCLAFVVSILKGRDIGIFILVASVLVLAHETGHLMAGRLVGIPVRRFVVGFGACIASFTVERTRVEIRAIPLFGFVEPYFVRDLRKEQAHPKSMLAPLPVYCSAPDAVSRPRRLLFILGGLGVNLVLAILLFFVHLLVAPELPEGLRDLSITQAAVVAFAEAINVCAAILMGLGAIFTHTFRALGDSYDPQAAGAITEQLKTSPADVLHLAGFISCFMVVLNLLPIPPLDGFRIVKVTLDMIFRRDLEHRVLTVFKTIGLAVLAVWVLVNVFLFLRDLVLPLFR